MQFQETKVRTLLTFWYQRCRRAYPRYFPAISCMMTHQKDSNDVRFPSDVFVQGVGLSLVSDSLEKRTVTGWRSAPLPFTVVEMPLWESISSGPTDDAEPRESLEPLESRSVAGLLDCASRSNALTNSSGKVERGGVVIRRQRWMRARCGCRASPTYNGARRYALPRRRSCINLLRSS